MQQKLYVAEYDLTFFRKRDYMVRHLRKCKLQHPPGDEIYRNGKFSMVRPTNHTHLPTHSPTHPPISLL